MFSNTDLQYENGRKWDVPENATRILYYSFDSDNVSFSFPDANGEEDIQNELLYTNALTGWSRFINNIDFVEDDNNADIVFFKTDFNGDLAGQTQAAGSGFAINRAEIGIDESVAETFTDVSSQNVLHEIGHALGLGHPGP